jgi:hypothetical protein
MFFAFPEDARWNEERQAVEFGVQIGEYEGVVRVGPGVFRRFVDGAVTPEHCVETYHLERTRFERIAERKLRNRQLTDDANVELPAATSATPSLPTCGAGSMAPMTLLPRRLPAHLRHTDRARRSEPARLEAPRLEPGQALLALSVGGRRQRLLLRPTRPEQKSRRPCAGGLATSNPATGSARVAVPRTAGR